MAKSGYLGLKVLPFDAARRADSKTLTINFIGLVLGEVGAINNLQGGRVGALEVVVVVEAFPDNGLNNLNSITHFILLLILFCSNMIYDQVFIQSTNIVSNHMADPLPHIIMGAPLHFIPKIENGSFSSVV